MQRTGTTQLFTEEPHAVTEAAMLFAAGHARAAAAVLAAELERDGQAQKPWLMLLELHRASGDRLSFERLAGAYRNAFQGDAPAWSRDEAPAPGMVPLQGVLATMADLAPLIEHARHRRMVGIDLASVERIDFNFAGDFCALLRGYSDQGKRIILGNISNLHAELLEGVGGIRQIVLLRNRASAQGGMASLRAA